MANEQNLIPQSERTKSEQREIASKGGKASGAARRKKADMRKIAQEVLDGTFSDKNGQEITGGELLMKGLITNLSKPDGKNWGKAVDTLAMLTGANITPEQKAKLKADTQLAKAKSELLKSGSADSIDPDSRRKVEELVEAVKARNNDKGTGDSDSK